MARPSQTLPAASRGTRIEVTFLGGPPPGDESVPCRRRNTDRGRFIDSSSVVAYLPHHPGVCHRLQEKNNDKEAEGDGKGSASQTGANSWGV